MLWSSEPIVTLIGAYPDGEGVAAGCARVSRENSSIKNIVQAAKENTESSRRIAKKIVFSYGHSSISEHAPYTLSIENISRALSLDLISHRLISVTQMSNRYISLSSYKDGLFFLPEKLPNETALRAMTLCYNIYEDYKKLLQDLLKYYDLDEEKQSNHRMIEEQLRYMLPLALTTRLTITTNSREWLHIIQRLLSSDLLENVIIGNLIKDILQQEAPSLFPDKYISGSPYPQQNRNLLRDYFLKNQIVEQQKDTHVDLLYLDPPEKLLHILFSSATGIPFQGVDFKDEDYSTVFSLATRDMDAYQSILREFESYSATFLLNLSESCLIQLLRHRMSSPFLTQREGKSFVVPNLIKEASSEIRESFEENCSQLLNIGNEINEQSSGRGDIFYPNGLLRQCTFSVNARSLVSISRLRLSNTAQEEIRNLVQAMMDLSRENAKLALSS